MTSVRLDRLSQVQPRTVDEQQQFLRAQHRPLDLFATESFQRIPTVRTETARVDLPTRSSEQNAMLGEIVGRVPEESRPVINQALNDVTEAIYDAAPGYIPGDTLDSGLTQTFNESFEIYMTHSGHNQRDAAAREYMFAAMAGFENDLAAFGLHVQAKTDQGRETRTEIAELEEMLASWPEEPADAVEQFTYTEVQFNEDGTISTREITRNITKAEAESLLMDLENTKISLREATELETFDLQTMTQDFQRAINLISAIFEDVHKTRTNMINNLKA